MSLTDTVYAMANRPLGLLGAEMLRKKEARVLRHRFRGKDRFCPPPLADDAAQYLQTTNPRLRELVARYRAFDGAAALHSQWTENFVDRQVDLQQFRADNAYVYQYRDDNLDVHHALTAIYLQTVDRLGLLETLEEDGRFGVCAFPFVNPQLISRDLLDSITEIAFLDDRIGLSRSEGMNVLDIGAGYGRLAHRLARAFPDRVNIFCTDAVATSTFLSEFYLCSCGVSPQATAVPLDELEERLTVQPIDVAVNIHSFSECTLAAVRWWLDLVCRHEIRYVMIVPNALDNGGTQLLTYEQDKRRLDYRPELESRGYRLAAQRPKYLDPMVQQYGVSPTQHYLFELTS